VIGGEYLEPGEIALADQLLGGAHDQQGFEVAPEPACPRRGRKPDERRGLPVRVLQPGNVSLVQLMHLVEDHHLGVRISTPATDGLDRGDLHRLRPIGQLMIGLDDADVADALRPEHLNGLVDQRDRRDHEHHSVALALGALDDRGRKQRFSRAGRRLDYQPANALPYGLPNGLERLFLVWSQLLHSS
jgi:hypothetical protein